MRKFTAILFAALALLASCQNRGAGGSGGLRFGFTTEPLTFDPLSPRNTAEGRSILFNVFEGLVKPDTAGNMMPCIAESWAIEQGGLVYNFTLRDGVRFHDGSVLTAQDVKFSLETAKAMGFFGLDAIEEVKISGDKSVAVSLKHPDPEFLPYLTVGIVKAGNDNRERDVVGTGPFFIESYSIQQNLVMRKFDGYWQEGKPHLEKATIVFFENFDALMVALRGGSIDGAWVTGAMAAQLDRRFFDIFHNYSAAVHLLALNNASPPLDSIDVRLALNYGIDTQNIIDTAFFGLGAPSGSPIIPGLAAYYEKSLDYPYDPEMAVSLLERAGFGAGRALALEITVPSNYTMHVDTAQVIASQLGKIGVAASIKLVDWNTWLSDVYFGRGYQATIISLDSPVVSPRSFLARYFSGSGENFINFNSAEFDRIYVSSLAETDRERRILLYKEAQRVIAANAASVYIQDIFYPIAFRGGAFGGVLDYPLYAIDFASIYEVNPN